MGGLPAVGDGRGDGETSAVGNRRRLPSVLLAAAALGAGLAVVPGVATGAPADVLTPARSVETVVLTGADIPAWSSAPAVGAAYPYPYGALLGDRSAHDNGQLIVPPVETGVDPDAVTAFRWEDGDFVEVPVQVDERFPYFLANPDSDFGVYSGTDQELTYEWDAETWRKTAGQCSAEYPEGEAAPTPDPVASFDADDEIAFQAADAGDRAPLDALGPRGTGDTRQELAVVDPLTGATSYLYLFTREGGSSFDSSNGYVRYERAPDADEWIDRYSFADADPEKLGTSNTGYGPNLAGEVCRTDASHAGRFGGVVDGTPRPSTDRFVRDGVTVRTDNYEFVATGRWMVREMHVAKPGQPRVYGPDLIDRWKGRAFQSSPDSEISLVGFEDEQVNWEANSVLLGERSGPVRAIREVWGADSGTNVTKTETFYPAGVASRYRLRVHPIPADGLYTAWDYNAGVATKYFNALHPEGVDIDGVDDDIGNVEDIGGTPAYFDVPDPTLNVPLAIENWEQVSGVGDAGSLVYISEIENPTSLENATVVPYYRDDACFDDGTGDNPVPRPWPGEASTDQRVIDAYGDAPCEERQGAWGSHGVHFFFTGDTDNAFTSPAPVTELDVEWWQFAAPTEAPVAVGERYAALVQVPLQVVALAQPSAPRPDPVPTTIEISGDESGQVTDRAAFEVRLTDPDGPVAGAEVVLTIQGEEHRATTDDAGALSVSAVLSGPAGPSPIEASFAGDDRREPTSASATIDVQREDTTLTASMTRQGRAAVVSASLVEIDGAALGARRVDVVVDGTAVAHGTTGDDGRVEIVVPQHPRPTSTVEVVFTGDDSMLPSSATV